MIRLQDRTLKRVYEDKNVSNVGPLLEVDQKIIQQVDAAVGRLKDLVPPQATIFNKALEDAKVELGKYIQGGLKQAFKNLFSDPVAKATTLAQIIKKGMSQLPSVLKLYLPAGYEKEAQKSIWDLTPTDKQKELLAAVAKLFTPDSTSMSDLVAGNKLPYLGNLTGATQELLQNLNPQGGFKLAQSVAATQTPPAQTSTGAAPDQQATGQTTQNQQTQASQQATRTASSQQATPTQATAATGTTAANTPKTPVRTQQPTRQRGQPVQASDNDAITNIADDIINAGVIASSEKNNVVNILKAIAAQDRLVS